MGVQKTGPLTSVGPGLVILRTVVVTSCGALAFLGRCVNFRVVAGGLGVVWSFADREVRWPGRWSW